MRLRVFRLFLAILSGLAIGLILPAVWGGISGAEKAGDSPTVRYARALVALAEANFKRVQVTNQRVANAVPRNVVAEYREDV